MPDAAGSETLDDIRRARSGVGLGLTAYDAYSGLSPAVPSGASAYMTGPEGESKGLGTAPAGGAGAGAYAAPALGAALDIGLEAAYSKKPAYQQGIDAAISAAGAAAAPATFGLSMLGAQLAKQGINRMIGAINKGDWDHVLLDALPTGAGIVEDFAGLFGVNDIFGFGPSKAWQTFPKRLSGTLRGSWDAGSRLLTDLGTAKTTDDVRAAIGKYNNAVVTAGVGDYLTNTTGVERTKYGPAGYQISALPGATGTAHEGKLRFNWEDPTYGAGGKSLMQILGDAISGAVTRVGTPAAPATPIAGALPSGFTEDPVTGYVMDSAGLPYKRTDRSDLVRVTDPYNDLVTNAGWTQDAATGNYVSPQGTQYAWDGSKITPAAPATVTPVAAPASSLPPVSLATGGVGLVPGLRGLYAAPGGGIGWTYDETTGLYTNAAGTPYRLGSDNVLIPTDAASADTQATRGWTVNPSSADAFFSGPGSRRAGWTGETTDFLTGQTNALAGVTDTATPTPAPAATPRTGFLGLGRSLPEAGYPLGPTTEWSNERDFLQYGSPRTYQSFGVTLDPSTGIYAYTPARKYYRWADERMQGMSPDEVGAATPPAPRVSGLAGAVV